ncbi:MAG: hypothetical protein M3437_07255 [Chloroflexota bacterium]|nr:hypothetical protein [Chloroflexota bacterium]
MKRIIMLVTVAALMAAMLALEGVAWAKSTPQPVDPPPQVAQLRQQFEGLTAQQVEADGYVPEGPCVRSPSGVGAMGIHAINPELLQAQFPKGTMDPANPPVLLLDENGEVMGLEWEAADVGQGPMELFGQTIEIQPAHPGVEEPHYMMHIYFKPGGKVLFGTDPQTAFDPEGVCPEMSATATASSSASALAKTGGAFSLTPLAPVALLVGTGVLAFRLIRCR